MDVVVTVPKGRWAEWLDEGDLAGQGPAEFSSHFWLGSLPDIKPGERVYVVHNRVLRGYAPLTRLERAGWRWCLVRRGDAVAVTIPEQIVGFGGWRRRWWDRSLEVAFPTWAER